MQRSLGKVKKVRELWAISKIRCRARVEEVEGGVDAAGKQEAAEAEGEAEGVARLRKVAGERISRVGLGRRPSKARKVKDVERVGRLVAAEEMGMARVQLARCNA